VIGSWVGVFLAATLIMPATYPGAGSGDPESTFGSNAGDASMNVFGATSGTRATAGATPGVYYVYRRKPQEFCGAVDGSGAVRLCVEGVVSGVVVRVCADGSVALDPLFRREVDPVSGAFVGQWVQVDVGGCPEDPATTVVLSAAQFRRLPLTASVPQVQPADGRGLVNVDLIVFTDPDTQVLSTTVLGVPVTVRATPVRYAWDFGDGTDPLVTTDPGAPYPAQTVARPYRTEGTYQLTLQTTWTGTYQVNATGPWHTVTGTATTTSTPLTTQALTATTTLVADPLP